MSPNNPSSPPADLDGPLSKVAQAVLRAGLVTVCRLYKRVTRRKSEQVSQVEDVHYLRVGTRRTLAALHLYKDLFPQRHLRRMKKVLRKIRRVAGPARDLDVLIPWLQEVELPPEIVSMREATLTWATLRRKQVQSKLHELHSLISPRRLKKKMQRLLNLARWRSKELDVTTVSEPRLFDDGSRRLGPIAHSFFEVLSSDVSELEQLHHLRIEAKRLRYSLDLLPSAFSPDKLAHLAGQLRELQDGLGVVNDRAEAQRILREWESKCDSPQVGAVVLYLIQQNESSLEAARLRFRTGWTTERIQRIQASLRDLLPKLQECGPPPPNKFTA